MSDRLGDRVRTLAKTLSLFGKSTATAKIQEVMLPHIMRIFSEYDHRTVHHFIITDYPLVEEETPAGLRNAIHNLSANPDLRQQWAGFLLDTVTPENILDWMRTPEAWLDDDSAAEQRENLRRCAEVIEETDGGEAWLEAQVWTVYQWARLVPADSSPEDSTRATAND